MRLIDMTLKLILFWLDFKDRLLFSLSS